MLVTLLAPKTRWQGAIALTRIVDQRVLYWLQKLTPEATPSDDDE